MTPQKLYQVSHRLRQIKEKQKKLYDTMWLYRFSFFVDNANPLNKWECHLVKQCQKAISDEDEIQVAKQKLIDIRNDIDMALREME